MTARTLAVAQGALVFLAVPLGVIPLARFVLTGHTGSVWTWLPGEGRGPGAWLGPLAVVIVVTLAVVVLERRRTGR